MVISKHDRDELLARWQSGRGDEDRAGALGPAVAELIDEACMAVAGARVTTERCRSAGDALGRAWRVQDLDLTSLVDELSAVRRSVWEAVVKRSSADRLSVEALLDARSAIDLVFDTALGRAVGAAVREPVLEPTPEPVPTLEADGEPVRADFHAALNGALVTAGGECAPLSLVVLHVDARVEGPEGRGADLLDVSEILRLQLRKRDLAFRLTESDHAIICVDTNAAGARHLLERITYALGLYGKRAGIALEVTGGYGVAPDDGLTSLELIRIALADREFSLQNGADASRV